MLTRLADGLGLGSDPVPYGRAPHASFDALVPPRSLSGRRVNLSGFCPLLVDKFNLSQAVRRSNEVDPILCKCFIKKDLFT